MLLNICCEIINTDGQSFEQIFKGLNLEEQKKILINEETQDKQQEIRSILKKTIEKSDAVEEQLKALKFSFLGEKGRMRRNLIKLSDRIYLAKSSNRYSLDGRIETIYIEKTWDEKTVPNFVIAIDFRESDFKYIAHIQGLKSIIGELNNQFLSAAGGYRSFVATMLGGSSDFTTLQIQIIHEIKWTSFYD